MRGGFYPGIICSERDGIFPRVGNLSQGRFCPRLVIESDFVRISPKPYPCTEGVKFLFLFSGGMCKNLPILPGYHR